MFEKKAITTAPIDDMIARRWSGRAYEPERAVEPDKLLSCIEAARWAPSCFGAQPWRYIICDRAESRDAWEDALHCLAEGNQAWARQAPVLIVSVASDCFEHNATPNRWAKYDTGAASMSLCLQATSLGLMAHQMGGFDTDKARQVFSIPEGHTPMAMIAIGYQMAKAAIPAELHEREFAERQRHPIGDHFFADTWNKPYC